MVEELLHSFCCFECNCSFAIVRVKDSFQTCFKCGRRSKYWHRTPCRFHPFSKHPTLQYKWEAYCNTNGRSTNNISFSSERRGTKSTVQYNLEAYCNTNWRCIDVVVVGVSDVLPSSQSCPENAPEFSKSSENGLPTTRALFLKLGSSPGFWSLPPARIFFCLGGGGGDLREQAC